MKRAEQETDAVIDVDFEPIRRASLKALQMRQRWRSRSGEPLRRAG
jgi:hypothetical protein